MSTVESTLVVGHGHLTTTADAVEVGIAKVEADLRDTTAAISAYWDEVKRQADARCAAQVAEAREAARRKEERLIAQRRSVRTTRSQLSLLRDMCAAAKAAGNPVTLCDVRDAASVVVKQAVASPPNLTVPPFLAFKPDFGLDGKSALLKLLASTSSILIEPESAAAAAACVVASPARK